jgi:hypothetical protein
VTSREAWRGRVLQGQSAYYVITGLWPVVHMSSFEAITGPKVDDWLVRMVGLLAAAIGAALGVAARRGRGHEVEVLVLAAGSALAFTAIDLRYALAGQISPIYLADALVEVGLLAALGLTRLRGSGS